MNKENWIHQLFCTRSLSDIWRDFWSWIKSPYSLMSIVKPGSWSNSYFNPSISNFLLISSNYRYDTFQWDLTTRHHVPDIYTDPCCTPGGLAILGEDYFLFAFKLFLCFKWMFTKVTVMHWHVAHTGTCGEGFRKSDWRESEKDCKNWQHAVWIYGREERDKCCFHSPSARGWKRRVWE